MLTGVIAATATDSCSGTEEKILASALSARLCSLATAADSALVDAVFRLARAATLAARLPSATIARLISTAMAVARLFSWPTARLRSAVTLRVMIDSAASAREISELTAAVAVLTSATEEDWPWSAF